MSLTLPDKEDNHSHMSSHSLFLLAPKSFSESHSFPRPPEKAWFAYLDLKHAQPNSRQAGGLMLFQPLRSVAADMWPRRSQHSSVKQVQ